MYESFFGLKEKPFNLTPDPDFLYLNTRTREAFDEILYGIERREGFAVIVGDVGTGKTTLSCALIEKIEGHESIRTVLIQNPMLSELDILRSILQDLGVSPEDPGLQRLGSAWTRDLSKKELIDCLNVFLAERARENAFTVLIIDEAQNLSVEMLEQLRLLSNLETTKKKLLQIIFLGQPELERKLAKLRQLNQRISVRFSTRPFSREDTEKYIRHRLAVAGDGQNIRFGPGALDTIHRFSRGYPRLINLICDRALREACRQHAVTVTRQMARAAASTLTGKDGPLRAPIPRRLQAAGAAVFLIAAGVAAVRLFDRWTPVAGPRPPLRVLQQPAPQPARSPAAPSQAVPAKPDLSPAAAEAPAEARQREYSLQVYSFRTPAAAEAAAKQLRGLNLPSYIRHHASKLGEGWFGVYAGPFQSAEAARQADPGIRAATGATPLLRGTDDDNSSK